MNMLKNEIKYLFMLHMMLMIYSMSGICSKKASSEPFFSRQFCIYYSVVILLLGFYAVCWQQLIKKISLTTAFANKSVTVIWGMIWGKCFFDEAITIGKFIGIALITTGIVLFAISDRKDNGNG